MLQGQGDANVQKFISDVDIVPVRLYLPAGDSYAKTAIRRWFRNNLRHRVGYKSAAAVSIPDSVNSNLIVLASRSSLPIFAAFQSQNHLRLTLTESGIGVDNKIFLDRVTVGKGTTLSHVILTNWRLDTGKVHTYIASNHTRAIQAVADMLVNENEMLTESFEVLLVGGRIPDKFQIGFEVSLHLHETNATVERVWSSIDGEPLVY